MQKASIMMMPLRRSLTLKMGILSAKILKDGKLWISICGNESKRNIDPRFAFNTSVFLGEENKRKQTPDLQMAAYVVPVDALNIHKLGYLTWDSLFCMEKKRRKENIWMNFCPKHINESALHHLKHA